MKSYNVKDRGMPKGIYKLKGDRWRASVWQEGGELIWQRTFDTQWEAEYHRQMFQHDHKWEGMEEGPYFGFVYLITNRKTGKMYVGKKQLYFWDGPVGGFKCTDPSDEWWTPGAWQESDWKEYRTSQKELSAEIYSGEPWDFKYEVLHMCKDKLSLHLAEVGEQIQRDVLEATDEAGEYQYYNKNIASMVFRAPFKKADLVKVREESALKMRDYYLKPVLCPSCDRVIPYGEDNCGCSKDRSDT